MKRRHVVCTAFVFGLVAHVCTAGCRVTPLDVGKDRPEPVEVPDATVLPEAEAPDTGAPLTLEQKLRARCFEEAGPNNAYYSARELTERIVGRWFICDSVLLSSLNDGEGDGFAFNADGTWAVLFFNAARDDFVAETKETYNFGKYRYHSFADADAGAAADAGIVSRDVDRDDPSPRTSLVVYLDRKGTGLGPDPHSFTFSRSPKQMEVVEYGPSPLRARYVPID